MHHTQSGQAKASAGFVEQVETYVQRCLQGIAANAERRGAGADPNGPGRPLELPKVALWSGLLLCVLQGARGVREIWRYLVLHGYDICDQTPYDRFEQEGEQLQRAVAEAYEQLAARHRDRYVRIDADRAHQRREREQGIVCVHR